MEVFYDSSTSVGLDHFGSFSVAADDAIEAATRVKITDEALALMNLGVGDRRTRLKAALFELGFEVEE